MNQILKQYDGVYFLLGRVLLGSYFLLPGVMKAVQYSGTLDLMIAKGVPLASILLPLTIVLQIGLGLMVIVGKQLRVSALLLFGLTILINVYIHNFWALQGEPSFAHELQNFIKNLGIAAGLLVLATKQTD
ncbi:DoxX family protein [Arenicella sp. 4NH20-0111]|uniref:DoxX family protein n=1 Tax=Arenicella sp. 4NH20-0111 TaxID=3127648 RepID=UPI00310B9D57